MMGIGGKGVHVMRWLKDEQDTQPENRYSSLSYAVCVSDFYSNVITGHIDL
jgi:hypothetical protein